MIKIHQSFPSNLPFYDLTFVVCFTLLKQSYNSVLQKMLKKDPSSCFFGTCASPIKPEKEVIVTSHQDLLAIKRRQLKMSLKQKNRKSIDTTLSIVQHLSMLKSYQENSTKVPSSNKQNKLGSNLSFTTPGEKQTNEKDPLKLTKTTLKKQSMIHAGSSLFRELKRQELTQNDLQKTAKLSSTNLGSTQNQAQYMQTRQLNKGNFISTLKDFKQSIVSINEVETTFRPPKLEESTVMIDFFHPPQEKALELQSYLIQRT